MLYEQYRSRIAKVADVLGAIRKYRILIILICAFIAALTATLLGVSGIVYDMSECPAEVVAGEELPYRAGAIFNHVTYEFSVNGSNEWTEQKPARPAEYLVRCVSNDIAGKPRYGKTHAFTIIPRTVVVTADCSSAVYGELPPVKAQLLYSDTITCSEFTYSDYTTATTTVEPVAEAICAYDENGNDVSYTYNFQTQSCQMDFIKRGITVNLSPYVADYDGKEHPKIPYTDYEISNETPLAEGDFEEVYVRVFRTQAGEYENEIYFKIYKQTANGNVEVTSNYEINVSSGTLTVNKRTLEITTADLTAVYDGLEKWDNGFTLAQSSLSALTEAGHTISVTGNTVEKNAGEYENKLDFVITDEDGNDVTSNYAFSFTYGTLKIAPRPLTCTTYSAEWIYDGQTHSDNSGFVILKDSTSSYASDDEIAYFIEGSQMHVKEVKDSCKNQIKVGVVNSVTGEDVTDNYAVNYICGDLTVLPRPINVKVDDAVWEYDGESHSSSEHTITFDSQITDTALVEGHTITARGLKTIINVGSVPNSIDFGIYEGEAPVTDNYAITWSSGNLTVTRREITVSAKSNNKIYDGTPLTSGGVEVVSQNKLVKGHSISAQTEGIIINAGTTQSSITDKNTITITDENGEDASGNYEIVGLNEGTLTVTPRVITITAGSAKKVYDAAPLMCSEYSVSSELQTPIAEGQELTVTTAGSVTEVNSETNTITAYAITWGETDVTSNYEVTCKGGLLTVTKRPVTIKTASTDDGENKRVYNALPQSLEKFEEVQEDNIDTGLVTGHTAHINKVFYATDADTYENDLTFVIKSGERDVTSNYELTIIKGRFTITKRPLTVITHSKEFEYDSKPHSYEGHTVSAETPLALETHTTVATNLKTITDVVKESEPAVRNTMSITVLDGEGKNVSKNYAIAVNAEGILTVTPLHISVVSGSTSVVYNGGKNSYLQAKTAEGSNKLVPGHQFTFTSYTEVVDVRHDEDGNVLYTDESKTAIAGYVNKLTVGVKDGTTDVSHNYIIDNYTYGTITITPRPIKFRTATKTWIFDGTYHDESMLEDVDRMLLDGAPYYHLPAYIRGELPRVKYAHEEVLNKFKIYIVISETQDISYNYAISCEYGTLKVAPLPVTVTANSKSKVYDGTALTDNGFKVTSDDHTKQLDSIKNLKYTFEAKSEGTITNVGKADNIIVENSFKVYDDKDQRVALRNFEITYASGILEVTQRKITVKAGDAEKTYDGEPLECKQFEKCTVTSGHSPELDPAIVAGQTLSVVIISSYVNAGTWDNVIDSCTITDAQGGDVTHNYLITKAKGSLVINKRPLTITTLSKTDFIYDGEEKYYLEYEITEGTLVGSHTHEVDTEQDYTKVINAEEKNNEFTVIILDGETDVSGNYLITYNENCGKIKVNPRPVIIATGSGEKVYDGAELYCEYAETSINSEYRLVDNHTFEYTSHTSVTDVQLDENKQITGVDNILGIKIKYNGEDVTGNYDIVDWEYGTLTVTPRPISVYAEDTEKIYDGEEIVPEGNRKFIATYNGETGGALINNHTISADIVGAGADAGTYDIRIGENITIKDGVKDVTFNYEITPSAETAKLTVKPRPITLVTNSDLKIYDGTPLTNKNTQFNNLVKDHKATVDVTGSQTDAGSSTNTFAAQTLKVTTADGNTDVTKNYYIDETNCITGELTVTQRPIKVITESATKPYNGTPLTNGNYTVSNLVKGHKADITITGTITEVGQTPNTFDENFTVTDADNRDVSHNYYLVPECGELTVTKRHLTITSGSAEKVYDGTPLKYDNAEITEGSLVKGHTTAIFVNGEQTEVGESANTFEVDIHDENGNSILANYELSKEYGTLTVTADTETSDNDSTFIRVKSDTDGIVYLREKSLGDYISGMSWTQATPYDKTIEYGGANYGYNYLTSLMLQSAGNTRIGKVDIELLYNAYVLPYYVTAENNHAVQQTDTVYKNNGTFSYSANYIVYDYLTDGKIQINSYTAQEAQYAKFVKDNYLTVDNVTREFLQNIIKQNGLSKDDIAGVAEYIKGTATYNLDEDYSKLESSQNVIISFLRDSEYGVCRHYAAAATMLYRTLGIPARYTTGFAVELQAGEWAELSVGHAWVELYIDGLGWVAVEVTPSSSISGEDEGEEISITLKPKDEVKTYDGAPLVAAELETELNLNLLLEQGYSYKVEFAGSQTEIGESKSFISSFILYAPDGSVDNSYKFEYKEGLLKVISEEIVIIHTYSKHKEYDGTPMYFKSNEYYASGLPAGYRAEVKGLEKISFTQAGILSSEMLKSLITVTIYNPQGEDVTSSFYLDYDPDYVIDKRTIVLTTKNVSKTYDGTELIDDEDPQITFGSLISGHRIVVTQRASIVDTGETTNAIGYQILDRNGADVSVNYSVTTKFGKLTITEGD
ncbi:MAG: transglutaminase-like domain-containing protein [Clostridia bacterium]|nr:transglutaminase-like domain-containing protein [Clostridia bacterium]